MSDINMTPLVDVMLVLVVIFILTAPLLASAIRLICHVPRVRRPLQRHALTLVLDRQGQVFVDDQPVPSAAALARRLGEVAQAAPDTELQLRADAAVPYGRVVEVMGRRIAAGLQRIGFVADPAAAPAPLHAVR